MTYRLISIISALFLLSSAYGQSDPAEELKTLLPAGTHTARFFQPKTPETSEKDKALQGKISKILDPYYKNGASDSMGNPGYLERLLEKGGVTKEELKAYAQRVNDQANDIQMVGVDSFEIKRAGDIISFHGLGSRCRPLDSLFIDLDANGPVH